LSGCLTNASDYLDTGIRIDFENAESIPFSVHKVALPACLRYRELGECNDSSQLQDLFLGCVELFNL
jgi:hypothetical protein